MKTLDVRVRITPEVIRDSGDFHRVVREGGAEDLASAEADTIDSSEEADSEFSFFDSAPEVSKEEIEEKKKHREKQQVQQISSIFHKARTFCREKLKNNFVSKISV